MLRLLVRPRAAPVKSSSGLSGSGRADDRPEGSRRTAFVGTHAQERTNRARARRVKEKSSGVARLSPASGTRPGREEAIGLRTKGR